MGRHSASRDDEDEPAAAAVDDERAAAALAGRHAWIEPGESERDTVARPQEAPPAPPVKAPKVGRGHQSTAADLALLRAHSDVRARVIAALVVPFVLYTAVLYLIGGLDVYLPWVWIPLVTAGVLAGSILDLEHRKHGGSADR